MTPVGKLGGSSDWPDYGSSTKPNVYGRSEDEEVLVRAARKVAAKFSPGLGCPV